MAWAPCSQPAELALQLLKDAEEVTGRKRIQRSLQGDGPVNACLSSA